MTSKIPFVPRAFSDICPICHDTTITSPVYPAAFQYNKVDLEEKTIEFKLNKVCQHIFYEHCLSSWLRQVDSSNICPLCTREYTDVIQIKDKVKAVVASKRVMVRIVKQLKKIVNLMRN
ncbi:hypothetical protein LCGC14_2491750 [marine sediment metagenome]|uniref:Anaphase-promoting complex subunit 11 n=1 Tax=marine sediment metagenome TaxID=412755 RepID=A0A0F9B584_9ZZZZ